MAGIAAIEPTSIAERSVAVFEEMLAFLRKMPARAGRAVTAGVGERPSHALTCGDASACALHHVPNGFVTENARSRGGAAAHGGVQVRAADGGERNFHQHLAAVEFIGKRSGSHLEGLIRTLEELDAGVRHDGIKKEGGFLRTLV